MIVRRPVKDCWLAVNLSGIIPGLGQFYGDQWTKAIVIFSAFVVLVIHSIWSLFAAEGSTTKAFWLIGAAGVVYLLNVWDAFATVGRPLYPLGNKRQGQDVWYGVFLSQILPGLGQWYLGQAVVGGLFLAVGAGLAMMANYQTPLLPVACTVWSIAGYHAYRSTPASPMQKPSRSTAMLAVVILGSLLLRLGIGSVPMWIDQAVLQCIVPSESMMPTLQVGDRTFVSRNSLYQPALKDIVVFKAPPEAIELLEADSETLFVKRVIGLPGKTVEVRAGNVWIDGQILEEAYVDGSIEYQWGPELVPPESYFVLGDNRNASGDSHVWGFLPRENIVGTAYKIYWPADRVRSLQR
ncbi:signal peptidase I [cf. Phormidesmis sp. LEGE 11477]|uniref:signal peptidase I n=1 Tax=cf. Phormidesmis sp. LEGE 11477 TaxID=1828680 RepID=UPI001880096F|nr:signal peptidase I [cf. Phormidesmis sp. LEGE 11477]MBE9062449.1 signal peptidase I [cf. Phormidesmis sp. LEGE 11477]